MLNDVYNNNNDAEKIKKDFKNTPKLFTKEMYECDFNLFCLFKNKVMNDPSFVIPELFFEKYKLFKELNDENMLSLKNINELIEQKKNAMIQEEKEAMKKINECMRQNNLLRSGNTGNTNDERTMKQKIKDYNEFYEKHSTPKMKEQKKYYEEFLKKKQVGGFETLETTLSRQS